MGYMSRIMASAAPVGELASSGWRALTNYPRDIWARTFGMNGMGRDFYGVFGWDSKINYKAIWEMYHRGGIAKRIVHAYADAVWGNPPKVAAGIAWTKAWEELIIDQNVWSVLHRLDRLTHIGQYAILLIGTDSTNLEKPLGPNEKITFIQAYGDRSAKITMWGQNPGDKRFCLPIMYTIYPQLARIEDQAPGTIAAVQPIPIQGSYRVHYTRVLHCAQGQLENELFGIPSLWAIWNYLTDLQKVIGASSESFWNTANRGMQMDLDPEMDLDPDSEANLNQEVTEYFEGQRRFIRTRGIKVTNLGSDVADPTGPYKALINLISGTTGIPQRILVGSESSHQASTQDKGAWAERVDAYRELTSIPYFLKPFILKMMECGQLPTVKMSKIKMQWPDAYTPSPLERAQRANQIAAAANNFAMALVNVPNLYSIEEARQLMELEPEIPNDGTRPEPKIIPEPPANDTGMGKVAKPSGGGAGGSGAGNSTPENTSDANGKGNPKAPKSK